MDINQGNNAYMHNIGTRLREERNRLRMNQEDFAAIGGVKKRAQVTYEQETRQPDSNYLAAIAAAGVDVQYVLTGAFASAALAADENELLAGYRTLDTHGKARVLGMIEGMRPASPATPPSHVEFHGNVGQQVTGNITAPQTFHVGTGKKKSDK